MSRPNTQPKALDPFAVPASFLGADARRISRAARAQHDKKQSRKRPETHLPADTLRAMLRELQPFVRVAVEECGLMEEELYTPKGGSYKNDCAYMPPVVAHFAFVALALVEAEKREGLEPKELS